MHDDNNIKRWLAENGLDQYAARFVEHNIGFAELPDVTDQDLNELGLSIGHRKKFHRAVDLLKNDAISAQMSGSRSSLHGEAERRQLTVLFADLADSTALSMRLDPEDMRDIIRAYQAACTREIARFGGYSARYVGDGILVYFGYPASHENDPERCVRAGLGIVSAIRQLNEQASTHGARLQVRIGIATGIVVVGDLVSDGAVEQRAVVGDTPNLAARLQAVADPDTVVASPSTRELLGDLFEFHSLGQRRLKGIIDPVEPWQVVGAMVPESRFVATHSRQLTELVGRNEEMRILTKQWEQVVDGRNAVVLISGEPGVGKSRLIQEIRRQLDDQPHTTLIVQCWSHTENSSLYPIIELIQRILQFNQDDSVDIKLDKLDTALRDVGRPDPKQAQLIATLLGVDASGRYAPLHLSPDARKRETFTTLADIVAALADQQPVLVVFEDIHWMDPSTSEFISFLLSTIEDRRVMVIAAIRNAYLERWPIYGDTRYIELQPITPADTRTMIQRIAGQFRLPQNLIERITDRADGVPLYIEELTRLVVANPNKQAGSEQTIPSSLQDLLVARLNSLTWEREVAMLGAVLGRRFDYSLIDAVWQGEAPVLVRGLDRLVEAGILSQRRSGSENIYTFRHVLIQEAAYSSLLKSDRRSIHDLIAGVLEQRYADSSVAAPELLADHFEHAGRMEKAFEYLVKAGKQFSDRSANQEAIIHLNRALELLSELPEGPDRLQKELSVLVAVSSPLVRTRGYASPEAERTLERARELCAMLGDSPQLIAVLCGLSIFCQARGDLSQARELSEQALKLSEPTNDNTLCLLAFRSLGGAAFWQGDLESSRRYLEQGVNIYDAKAHAALAYVYFVDPGVVCLSTLALALWTLGFPDRALARARESVKAAEATYHPYSVGYAKLYLATINQVRLEPDPVRETALDVIALSRAQAFPQGVSWGKVLLGWALCRLGECDEGEEMVLQGIEQWRGIGTRLILPYFLALHSDVCLHSRQTEKGLKVLEEAFAVAGDSGERCWQAELYRLRGEHRMRQSSDSAATDAAIVSVAEADFRMALSEAQSIQAHALELRAAGGLARCLLAQDKKDEARVLLNQQCHRWRESPELSDVQTVRGVLNAMT